MPPTLRDDRLDHYLQLIDDLALSSLKTEYAFATLEDFEIQMETSVPEAMRTYWREILYLCHFHLWRQSCERGTGFPRFRTP